MCVPRIWTLAWNMLVILLVISQFNDGYSIKNKRRTKHKNRRTSKARLAVFTEDHDEVASVLRALHLQDHYTLHRLPDISDVIEYDAVKRIYHTLSASSFVAVIGHFDHAVAMAAQKQGIPYVALTCYDVTTPYHYDDVIVEIFPGADNLTSALVDLIGRYKWGKTAVIYEPMPGEAIVHNLLKETSRHFYYWPVMLPDRSNKAQDRELIRNILFDTRDLDISNILLLTEPKTTKKILQQAKQLGLVSNKNKWLIMNLMCDEIGMQLMENIKVNMTMISGGNHNSGCPVPESSRNESKLRVMKDAIRTIHTARLRSGRDQDITEVIKQNISFEGETGWVDFNNTGRRTNLTFNIHSFNINRFDKIGEWMSNPPEAEEHLRIPVTLKPKNTMAHFPLEGRKARVVTILEPPFTMLKYDADNFEGNEKYEGFVVDMMNDISKSLNFEYELYIVHDGKFGSKDENGVWNGIVGEVVSGNATMSMAPLSINRDRETAMDFTKPFKTRGITVLVKTPTQKTSYWQFLKPLSVTLWVCLVAAVMLVTVTIYVVERTAYRGPHNDDEQPRLGLSDSGWMVFSSLVQVGADPVPVTSAGRLLTAVWWLFALLTVATYTANLAAFLTVKKITPPITSVKDLAKQARIRYGTVSNSGVETFFKKTGITAYKDMHEQMMGFFPSAMVNSTKQGLAAVKESDGDYAFLWDNSVTSYIAATDCDFTEIGPAFDPKGFGIGVPSGAVYLDRLSMEILGMGDAGTIAEYTNKWWTSTKCDSVKQGTQTTSELQLETFAGMFFMLLGGLAITVVFGVIECIWMRMHGRRKSIKKKKNSNGSILGDYSTVTRCQLEQNGDQKHVVALDT